MTEIEIIGMINQATHFMRTITETYEDLNNYDVKDEMFDELEDLAKRIRTLNVIGIQQTFRSIFYLLQRGLYYIDARNKTKL